MPRLPALAKAALIGTALVGAAAGGLSIAGRRSVNHWANNPDPSNGAAPRLHNARTQLISRTDNTAIATHTIGDPQNQPTIVLVHGITCSSDDWGFIADRLVDQGFAVVAIDQRGHGASTVGTDGFGIGPQSGDVAAALAELDLHDVVLAGHSMGGMAVLGLASWHGTVIDERVAGIGLVATAAALARADQRISLRLGSRGLDDKLGLKPEHLRLPVGTAVFGKDPSLTMIDHLIASYLRCPVATRRGAAAGLATYDVRPHLPAIDTPATVICGPRDLVTPLSFSEELAERLPNAELHVIADAGHMLIWEEADLVADLLAGFAREVLSATPTA